jgi:membrane-bound inhibitor of C-type lysozyme
MQTRHVLIICALLCAAACDKPSPPPQAVAQATSDSIPAPVQAPPTPAGAATAALSGPAEGPGSRYSCEDGSTLIARYGAAGSGGDVVRLTLRGKEIELPSVEAASGAKYMARDGLEAGKSLTWWTEGNSAMLIQAPKDNPPDSSDGETIVNCETSD